MLIEIGAGRPGLVATVAPAHGGRTVALRLPGGENLIDPGTTDWTLPPAGDVRVDAPWVQDFGQVVWLGPQSRFWSDQTARPDLPGDALGWPPDPICTHAGYAVLEQSPFHLKLRSPASPVWQVEMTKTWTALADGSIRFHTEARNVSARMLRKGLWFNFRAPPRATVMLPVDARDALRIDGEGDLRPSLHNGWLTLHAPVPGPGRRATEAKAYAFPTRGEMRILIGGGGLQMEFPLTPKDAVAEGHAPAEVYRKVDREGFAILEVEQHARCVDLAPGRSMEHGEVWRWFDPRAATVV
jgi:hypothetical protein